MDVREWYEQPQISVDEQIKLLKSEGLGFDDEVRAYHLLENISLFRLKGYLRPFRREDSKQFKEGSTFEQAYDLYKFDSELRKLICSELEKIEVSVRTQLSLIMSEAYGVFWFSDSDNFSNADWHASLLRSLNEELKRSDDSAIVQFKNDYSNPFPPSWMTFEISSFGTLSILYKWLKPGHPHRKVAAFYGLSDSVFESWLHNIVYVRNICAHHSLLWNRKLRIKAVMPKRTKFQFIVNSASPQNVYYTLSIIIYLLQTVNPHNTFASRLDALFLRYPQVDTSQMGFPNSWREEPLWRH